MLQNGAAIFWLHRYLFQNEAPETLMQRLLVRIWAKSYRILSNLPLFGALVCFLHFQTNSNHWMCRAQRGSFASKHRKRSTPHHDHQ